MKIVLCLLTLLTTGVSAQRATDWKAGAAKIVITPTESIRMAGFALRTHASEGVRHDIYVKALALQDETGKTCVLVTADLVGVKRDIWDPVAARCEKQFGLSRDRLVLNESHSHSGPVVHNQPAGTAEEVTVRKYSLRFIDQAVEVVGQAIQRMTPARLAFGQGLAGIAVNRRRSPIFAGIPGGPVDHDVPVLSVRDPSGNLLAVVVGYACHPSVLMDYQISGDWAGYAQEEIEKSHPDAVALFMQGCGGDAFAFPRNAVVLAQSYGKELAAAVEQVLGTTMTPLLGPIRTAFDYVDLPFRTPPSRTQLQKLREGSDSNAGRHAERLLQLLDRDGKLIDRYPEPVEVWRFGRGLTFIALGGEIVVDYARRLKGRYGWDSTWVSGYSNDTFAYIPSLRVLNEGGYEGGDSMMFTDLPGPFAASVEDILIEKINDLVQQTSE